MLKINKFMRTLGLLLFAISLLSCSTTPIVQEPTAQDLIQSKVQTEEFAFKRAKLVRNVKYKLFIDLSAKSDEYKGEQKISFELLAPEDIYIDFQGGEILSATINGQVKNLSRGPVFIHIPKESIQVGQNEVVLSFKQKYSRSGEGLHRFQDPEDQEYYMYTNFEPYSASKFAPFFDQPDIKAPIALEVLAPRHWQVIGNSSEKSVLAKGDNKIWSFKESPKISTYIYALMAGPFTVWKSQYKKVPLRIFARKSLAPFVPAQEWFKITQDGMAYFDQFFGVHYPFHKYDQLIVPEFNAGAMENVGAVTFTENYIRRHGYSRLEKMRMYSTVLHEMAHMWFGNLVTMKWWNDLWLNESFATYMAGLAMVNATEYKDEWLRFFIFKQEAYREDQMATTHPISGEVKTSEEAFNSFDSITYEKGASVMKALSFNVGSNIFQNAIRLYMKRHAYQNTTLYDFVKAFKESAVQGGVNVDLDSWFASWLTTSGVDTINPSFICAGDRLKLSLAVSANSRPHATRVSAYKNIDNQVTEVASFNFKTSAQVRADTTSIEVTGSRGQCPDFIYANVHDHGYFKINYDPVSLKYLKENLHLVQDDFLRLMIIHDFWYMVREQKMSVVDFGRMALNLLKNEKNLIIVRELTYLIGGASFNDRDTVFHYWPELKNGIWGSFEDYYNSYENVLLTRINTDDQDLYKILLDALAVSARSPKAQQFVRDLLQTLKDPDRRWAMLSVLCRENVSDALDLVSKESERDKSDAGQKAALVCKAQIPDNKVKDELVKSLMVDQIKYSAKEADTITKNIFRVRHLGLIKKYEVEIYNALINIWPKYDEVYQVDMAAHLAPLYCDQSANNKLRQFLNKRRSQLTTTIRHELMMAIDKDQVCIKVKEYEAKNNAS